MTWDAWVLTLLISVTLIIVVGVLIEDISGVADYEKRLRDDDDTHLVSIRVRGRESLEHQLAATGHGRHRRSS
ncbi:hypothetical protein [Nocardia sp. NBC_00511]|uniref:hypothetical protein n=1 Tax=Nocardia sp. NBC_00511 TaxID=2903591 RepID=UPI0030DE32F4